MTTITTFEDILDVLARDPQLREAMRQHVLDEELRKLPAIVREMRAGQSELSRVLQDFMTAANERLARLEAGQDELRAGQSELRAGQSELSRVLQDFMAATNERLARLEIGQDELRAGYDELRATVAELSRVLQDFMAATNERLARLEAGYDELRAIVAELSRVLQDFMVATNERLARLEAGQGELHASQDELRAGQAELKAGQAELKAGQDELRKDLSRMEERQNRMESDLSDVRGQLVPLAARRMVGRIADVTHSRRPRWLDNTDIIDIADEADTSAVPPNELDSFRAIDLAMRAIDKDSPDNQEQYIVIECTATITRNDIVRSERNSGYMSRFTGQPAKAVVIGYNLPDAVAELAREKAVHCVIATNKSGRPR